MYNDLSPLLSDSVMLAVYFDPSPLLCDSVMLAVYTNSLIPRQNEQYQHTNMLVLNQSIGYLTM